MKRAGHLFAQVVAFDALCAAARRAARGLWRNRSVAAFLLDLEPEVLALQRELVGGTYRPRPPYTFPIADPKPRTISAAAFCDRVVHHALCAALEPALERFATADSYACRRGKGNHAAVRRVQALSRRFPWYAKLDVRRYFASVDLAVLAALLRRRFKDRRALDLISVILEAGAVAPGRGLPIGNLTSQHLANFYLGHADHAAKETIGVRGWVRYMDDMILLGPDKASVRKQAASVDEYLAAVLRLEVKREASILAPVRVGVPFLGFRIWPRQIRLDAARARRFRRRFRALDAAAEEGRIDEEAQARSAASLAGWAAQADTLAFRRSFFERLDACRSRLACPRGPGRD